MIKTLPLIPHTRRHVLTFCTLPLITGPGCRHIYTVVKIYMHHMIMMMIIIIIIIINNNDNNNK